MLTYELTGIGLESGGDQVRYLTPSDLRDFKLSDFYPAEASAKAVEPLAYQKLPDDTKAQRRIVEHVRTLYFNENLKDPMPFRELNRLALKYEDYKLALTEDILAVVFGTKLTSEVRTHLSDSKTSGYLSGADLVTRFGASATPGEYWIRSGIAGFATDAAAHFYLPERYTDPFDNETKLEYDSRDLFVAAGTDALFNTTRITRFDYRVLAPCEMKEINDNLSEVFFDVLGLPTAMAVKGKGSEGDNLTGFTDALANPSLAEVASFFNAPTYNEAPLRTWLDNATARHVYYFGETSEKAPDGTTVIRWGQHPPCACGIVREQHVSQLAPGCPESIANRL